MPNSKKITLLISSLTGGGAEGVCVNIANGLADIGWQVDLVILHTNNAEYLSRVSGKVKLVVLGVHHARLAPLPLLRYIRVNKPSKILVFDYELAVIAVILRLLFHFTCKIVARNINTFSKRTGQLQGFWRRYIVRTLIRYFYGKCDHIINQCQAMRDDLVGVFPYLMSKTSVIYNPVAQCVENYANLHDLSTIEKQNYLLCVGRLERQKAFHYAIEAFAGIAQTREELRLKIVGKGSLEAPLRQLASDLNVADRVDFEGFQSDIVPYYLHAHATLLTSLYEGFPNALIESITLGTPVIAFDSPGGVCEIVKHAENGYLVKDFNLDDLKESIVDVLDGNIRFTNVCASSRNFMRTEIIKKYASVFLE
ncbi:glycosyltransferase [Marinomonas shanghaiensis]|uniref:glycosyltransferase n=1 Tax=Marinomonas shanghaiensis TaxID=2202418 RepID=UPI000DB97610|nr:glycosyltransferase [Marinomonas shanghaiensis]